MSKQLFYLQNEENTNSIVHKFLDLISLFDNKIELKLKTLLI